MTLQTKKGNSAFLSEEGKDWFSTMVHVLRTDKEMMESGIAPKETTEMYEAFIANDELKINSGMKEVVARSFTRMALVDYVKELKRREIKPIRLGFDYSDSSLLVWAEIADDDEATEDALIMTEAKVNAKYSQYKYYVSTTIVEQRDRLDLPPHYTEAK